MNFSNNYTCWKELYIWQVNLFINWFWWTQFSQFYFLAKLSDPLSKKNYKTKGFIMSTQLIIIIEGCYSLKIILWHSLFIYIPTKAGKFLVITRSVEIRNMNPGNFRKFAFRCSRLSASYSGICIIWLINWIFLSYSAHSENYLNQKLWLSHSDKSVK